MEISEFAIGLDRQKPIDFYNCIEGKQKVQIAADAIKAVEYCRSFLEREEARGNIHYGINTGFGHLCDVSIDSNMLGQLQENLLLSHACGSGNYVPDEVARTILLLKIKNLSLGHSGIRLELIDYLVQIFNSGAVPLIHEQGSLGASGDLAPLAHMSLCLLGEGDIKYKDGIISASGFLKEIGLKPLRMVSKEGLALINGTQFSTAYGLQAVVKGKKLLKLANLCSALSLEAFNCRLSPFDARVHYIRPHPGQKSVAAEILDWLKGSGIEKRPQNSVQDPYSFRCIPQVQGAVSDLIDRVHEVIETEINSVSDNPLIFPDDQLIVSGGNFHAQPIAFSMDHLALGLCELGSIAERRIYQLINGHRGLPVCLIKDAGINSGLMILQYSAASTVSLNKQLATPSSVDSIISSMGQEDHVSMAANAAVKTYTILNNTFSVLAMEYYTAMQALSLRDYKDLAPSLQSLLQEYRELVPVLESDRNISKDVELTKNYLEGMLKRF
ncbi:MAG: histidine ammonia-lyase [Saprospirales bacterium]|nr:MAG: histidine ammonia-lyase [Saprospirales bacterium]